MWYSFNANHARPKIKKIIKEFSVVESKIKENKINVVLTKSGREFASIISKLR
jgi:hypothetical protein